MKDEEKKPTTEKPPDGISRRSFIKGVGISGSVLSTGLLGTTLVPEVSAQSSSTPVLGPSAVPVELTINGQRQSLRVEPRVTLLEALRDRLELTGAKKVCDRATCGACTVLMDGLPVYSCSVLAIEAQGKRIETVESLAQGETLQPVQAAFVENDAQQCGFCTPGMVMAVKAFLDKHLEPTPEQVRLGLGGNLCRCGTYAGIREVIFGGANGSSQRPVREGGSNA